MMNNAISIFSLLVFYQSLILNVICVLQSNNIVLCMRFYDVFTNRDIFVCSFLSGYNKLPYCLQILFLLKECRCLMSACNYGV